MSGLKLLKDFHKKNDELNETMKTHFIDVEKDGIWDNNYEAYIRHLMSELAAQKEIENAQN